MIVFLVEDKPLSLSKLTDAMKERNWSHYSFAFKRPSVSDEKTIRRFVSEVSGLKPDIVVLDAALTPREERLLDDLRLEGEEVSEGSLSGFRYCRALANERLGIPIVFLTKSPHGQVARMAMRVGADRVLVKRSKTSYLLHEIEELVKTRAPHDPAFYWPMRAMLDDGHVWQADTLRKALDRFFLNESSVRRFGLFTASLREILSSFFQGDAQAERKLMLGLVKSQVLLSLVDPRLRDHVRHTGNVFWLGYRLLNDIPELHGALGDGYAAALYPGEGLRPTEQLYYAWTLAALFHDYGYVDERRDQLTELVAGLIPGISFKYTDVRTEASWVRNLRQIRQFVSDLRGQSHFLYHFIDSVMSYFGNEVEASKARGKRTTFIDHGILSAHRLLDMVPIERLDVSRRNIVLHATLAIACHNYVEILNKWNFGNECRGNLSLGEFPACTLLAFCDNLQTWDRESEVDPALGRAEGNDGLLERLVLSDTAYVSGSEISDLAMSRSTDPLAYDLNITLRYFVTGSRGVEEICETLGQDVQRWIDSGRLREVCGMIGIESLVHGRIKYQLPMLAGTHEATF